MDHIGIDVHKKKSQICASRTISSIGRAGGGIVARAVNSSWRAFAG